MNRIAILSVVVIAVISSPSLAVAQQNVPPAAQRAEANVESAVKRFGVGVQGGIGLDPEIIDFGAHATFGPVFKRNLQVRPGIEFGLGEITTLFGINVEAVYTIPGFTSDTRWIPYVGAGPNFSLSHRGFETEEGDHVNTTSTTTNTTTTNGTTTNATTTDTPSRFDFSDTDFETGMNFIVGMRRQSGMFFEMKATAGGVSLVRLLAGFNF